MVWACFNESRRKLLLHSFEGWSHLCLMFLTSHDRAVALCKETFFETNQSDVNISA